MHVAGKDWMALYIKKELSDFEHNKTTKFYILTPLSHIIYLVYKFIIYDATSFSDSTTT